MYVVKSQKVWRYPRSRILMHAKISFLAKKKKRKKNTTIKSSQTYIEASILGICLWADFDIHILTYRHFTEAPYHTRMSSFSYALSV